MTDPYRTAAGTGAANGPLAPLCKTYTVEVWELADRGWGSVVKLRDQKETACMLLYPKLSAAEMRAIGSEIRRGKLRVTIEEVADD